MEAVISGMLKRFESGTLTRRELIQGLAMLAVGGTASAAEFQEPGFKMATIDHISIQVTDLPRAIAFYQNVFGMAVVSEDKPNEIVRLGGTSKTTKVSLHHKSPTGLIDHYAIGVEPFNQEAMTRHLKEHGLTPQQNIDAGYHVIDPE